MARASCATSERHAPRRETAAIVGLGADRERRGEGLAVAGSPANCRRPAAVLGTAGAGRREPCPRPGDAVLLEFPPVSPCESHRSLAAHASDALPRHSPQPVAQSPCPPCLPTIGVECGRCPTEPVVPTVQGSLSPRTTIGQLATRLLVVDTTARNILRNLTLDRSGSALIEVHVGRSDIGSREGRGLGMPHPLKWHSTQREGER